MTLSRDHAEAFFDALMSRDPARIAPYVADDAEWLIVGPTELFPYCGQHLGREAVLAAYSRLGEQGAVSHHARDFMTVDGESAAAMTRMTIVQHATGREIIGRIAQFARFRDGKACEFCSIVDTLGVAEQITGRSLFEMTPDAPALAEV